MTRSYFGTDGVRGTVGEAPMTADFVLRLGYAAGKVLAAREAGAADRPAVLIGKDTRISGYMIEAALEAGFSAAGVDVLLCGPLPTPGVAYLTRALRLAAGVVISASHNPYGDNGIKIFSGDGFKLADAVESEIERALGEPIGCNASAHLGRARRVDDAGGRYVEFCKSTFPVHLDLRGLRLVVDCAHGAAYSVAPHVFHELGADVVPVGVSPDGFNINDLFGATSPAQLQAAVLRHQADLGIALDGDGDRLIMADAQGALYDGDQLLYAIVRHRAMKEKVAGVAGTLMTNLALEQAFQRLGVAFARARVGDRYVLELMREKGWQLGGENSGHIICLERHTTGDGIVSALQVLAAMRETQKTLGELTADLVMFPQVLVNVQVPRGFDWKKDRSIADAQAAAEKSLDGKGRVLLRPSGTEPLVRVMVEGESRQIVEAAANSIAAAVRRAVAG
ncbi:MAG: phosphoglucosamine mutase [Betaproteobacteria bacterium]|nr:phosphoglucosamine mutase [Betaproteobacteria bacterium]